MGGTIIFVVGLSLMPVALSDNIYHAKGELGQNILLAFIAAGTLIFFALLGSALKRADFPRFFCHFGIIIWEHRGTIIRGT